ncbi:MAG: TetR/AcrR family transcriptional regulator [Solirubrobacterales bacterium]|nr:TetR/AcrR family transcriptional regulator [Solirubrobacterales bacterium]
MERSRSQRGGRRAEAARNDGRILAAARSVFLADPSAPIADVAKEAGVGISALYRRYPSKEELLRELAGDGLTRYIADLRTALADDGDPWQVYSACLHRVVDGGSQALAQRVAGTFTPTESLGRLAGEASELAIAVHARTQRAGALRPDVSPADVVLILEMISFVDLPGPDRGRALRHRYLALALQALRAPGSEPLPGAPAAAADLTARWQGPLGKKR